MFSVSALSCHRPRRPLAVWSGILVFAPIAVMAAPVALVLDVKGEINPPVQSFEEMDAGSSFKMNSGGRIQFLLYPTCQNVVVEGGTLSLSAENFRVSKGRIIEVSRTDCPQKVELASTDASHGVAGVVLRGANDHVLKVSQRPEFVLLGKARKQFTRLRLMQGETLLLDTKLNTVPIKWPENLGKLQAGGDYSLQLTGTGVRRSLKLDIGGQPSQKTPAIIQLD